MIIIGVGVHAFAAAPLFAVGTINGRIAVAGALDADKAVVAGVVTTSAVLRIGIGIDTPAIAQVVTVGTTGLRDIKGPVVVFAKAVNTLQISGAIAVVGAAIGGLWLEITTGDR